MARATPSSSSAMRPLLARSARSATVMAQPALVPWLSGLAGSASVRTVGAGPEPPADVEIDVTELPHAFRTTVSSIPSATPYLVVDPARVAAAGARLGGRDGPFRVGLAWRSGAWKAERSIPLHELAGLRNLSGAALVSLQRGAGAGEWRTFAQGADNVLGEATSDDIVETAALLLNLHLVISVDTMVARLAGALGAPVWTLLHFAADWRWLLWRSDSPWYPSMRLFRQPAPGGWRAVAEAVLAAMGERLNTVPRAWDSVGQSIKLHSGAALQESKQLPGGRTHARLAHRRRECARGLCGGCGWRSRRAVLPVAASADGRRLSARRDHRRHRPSRLGEAQRPAGPAGRGREPPRRQRHDRRRRRRQGPARWLPADLAAPHAFGLRRPLRPLSLRSPPPTPAHRVHPHHPVCDGRPPVAP